MDARGDGSRRGVVGVLATVQFVVVVDETTVSLLSPAVAADLGLGAEARHLLVTPFAVAFALALPLTALLLASRRPGRVLTPAALLFALTAAAGGAADSATWLVVTRAAQGASAAVVTSCVLAALHTATRGHPRRAADFSLFAVVSGAGSVVALLVAGPLATVSWRLCLVAVGVAAAAVALCWPFVDPERRSSRPGAPVSPPATAPTPESPRRDVSTPLALAAVVAGNAALALTVVTTSFALQQGLGWSATAAGVGFLPLNAAVAMGAFVVSTSATRLGHARLLSSGVLVLALGLAALAVVPGGTTPPAPASSPAPLLAVGVLVGLGVGVVFPLASEGGLATADVAPLRRSAALGVAQQAGLASGALSAAAQCQVTTLSAVAALLVLAAVLIAADARGRPDAGTRPGAPTT